MRTILPVLAFSALAALGSVGCTVTTTIAGPDILAVTPDATDNGDGTYNVDLIVDFDDSATTGDLVDAYTFQTDDGQVNDVDVSLGQAVGSPFTIVGLTVDMDEFGGGDLGFHLILFGATTGEGAVYNGTIAIN